MNPRYTKIIIGVVVLIILIIGGWTVARMPGDPSSNDQDNSKVATEPKAGEIKVEGTINCLPYHLNVAGRECVKGIKGDDGKVYALNSIKIGPVENGMAEGTKVTAIGVFEPANTMVDESEAFSYDGVLVLSSLKRR